MRKRWLFCLLTMMLLTVLLAMPAAAEKVGGTCGDNVTWMFDDQTGTLTLQGEGEVIGVKTYQERMPWGDFCSQISNVVIGEGITGLGDYAFAYCEKVQFITIPATIKRMGSYVFKDCKALKAVYFLGDPPEMPSTVFSSAWGTKTAYYEFSNSLWKEHLANKSYNMANFVPMNVPYSGTFGKTNVMTYEIIDNTMYISGSGAMDTVEVGKTRPWYVYEDDIYEVVISENITSISTCFFEGMTSLRYVKLPNTLKTIEEKAFYQCISLQRIEIPNSVTKMGDGVFWGCECLQEVILSEKLEVIPQYTFRECAALQAIRIPDSVTVMGEGVFWGCKHLKQVTFPNALEVIPTYAFRECTYLREITIPASVRTIASYAFYACGLRKVVVPKTVTQMEHGVFSDCVDLEEATIEAQISVLESGVFYNCKNLRVLRLPKTITELLNFHNSEKYIVNPQWKELYFTGDPPSWGQYTAGNLPYTLLAYYPRDNPAWTQEARMKISDRCTWVPWPVLDTDPPIPEPTRPPAATQGYTEPNLPVTYPTETPQPQPSGETDPNESTPTTEEAAPSGSVPSIGETDTSFRTEPSSSQQPSGSQPAVTGGAGDQDAPPWEDIPWVSIFAGVIALSMLAGITAALYTTRRRK